MKYEKWTVAPPDPAALAALEEAGISPLLAAVLSARGVRVPQEARALLEGGETALEDPLALKDMAQAAGRVRLALERGETIAVYGDYDVDGITATCLLTDFLRRKGGAVIPYIPDRLEEGYGLNREAVTALKEQGASLIVTVDCGITALEETAWARSLGIDVVITDHHECKSGLPAAQAVVDPRRSDCPSACKGLAGVGVALKLAMAINGPEGDGDVLAEYCDLAAVGTVADVMPMTGENRTIVRLGLEELSHPRRLGLALLIREAGLEDKAITATSIGYTLAPRINASGRMGRAQMAVELLLTRDRERGEQLAQELCALNRERQTIEGEIFRQCVDRLDRAPQKGAVLLADPEWHQGVVGIVASRLTERYGCPAFMICLDHGMGKGSCRSWGGVNLFERLAECSDLLEGFGGHALAAGFTVREENIPLLSRRLREGLERALGAGASPAALEADAEVEARELTVEAVADLDRLEPCGTGNPRPVLVLRGALIQSMSQVGRGRHLKLRLESKGTPLDAIFFSADGAELGLAPGGRVDVAFYPQINEFRGTRSVQLQVADLHPAPTRAQAERAVYEKYRRGEGLTPAEARLLMPSRAEFVGLWRYLQRRCAGLGRVEDTASRIARGASRATGQREAAERVLLCLEVLAERGLIDLETGPQAGGGLPAAGGEEGGPGGLPHPGPSAAGHPRRQCGGVAPRREGAARFRRPPLYYKLLRGDPNGPYSGTISGAGRQGERLYPGDWTPSACTGRLPMRTRSTTGSCARTAPPISPTPWRWRRSWPTWGWTWTRVIAALLHDCHRGHRRHPRGDRQAVRRARWPTWWRGSPS